MREAFQLEAGLRHTGVDTLDIDVTAATEVAESMAERLEYELLAAWRMDYDYCYVWTKHGTEDCGTDRLNLTVKMGILPSNDPDWSPGMSIGVAERHDLRSLTREQVREIRGA